jgi:hypothetical protein
MSLKRKINSLSNAIYPNELVCFYFKKILEEKNSDFRDKFMIYLPLRKKKYRKHFIHKSSYSCCQLIGCHF